MTGADIIAKPLTIATRASLFHQLATMENAGLPALKSFALLELPDIRQQQRAEMQKLLVSGTDIATAGAKSGLFTAFEARLLRASLGAGSPAATYQRLADAYAASERRAAAIKSRLTLPALMLVIALLVQPLPSLVAGSLSISAYLWHVLRPLFALAGLYFFVMWFARQHALVLRTPIFGAMDLRRNAADFLQSLALLLEAGVPMLDALPDAVNSVGNRVIRKRFALIKPRMMQGASLAQALAQISATLKHPVSDQLIALVSSGETSGKLPETLQRLATGEAMAVQEFQQQVAVWLPRLIYAAVALWIAYGVLTGNAFMPHLAE